MYYYNILGNLKRTKKTKLLCSQCHVGKRWRCLDGQLGKDKVGYDTEKLAQLIEQGGNKGMIVLCDVLL